MSAAKDFYRKNSGKDSPLFHQCWWLDAVCENDWDVAVIQDGEKLKAYYLFATRKDFFGVHVIMPALTQYLGPNYQLNAVGTRQRNNEETEVLEQLLMQLPECSSFESRWNFRYQNWLPFHWKQYQQRTRYTYMLEDISNPESLRENFSEKVRREINKAEKQFEAKEAEDVAAFYKLIAKNFQGKKMKVPFAQPLLEKVFFACRTNRAGKILLAKDEHQKVAAGIFVAYDANTAYYIIGAKNDEFGNSGAMSLLFWSVFNELKGTVASFDFEGSMIKGVENYFRSFGALQKGFFEITKFNSPLMKMKATAKSLFRG